jgi:plasmid stabilization system protein ParE
LTAAAGIEWSPRALADLDRLILFLRLRSPTAAPRASAAIAAAAEQIRMFPLSGRPYANAPERLREVLAPFGRRGYVVLYQVRDDQILIVAVRHQLEARYQSPPTHA